MCFLKCLYTLFAEAKLHFLTREARPAAAGEAARPAIVHLPESALLARLKGFLPGMAIANQQLGANIQQQGIEAYSLEHEASDSDSEAGPHIEMDLTCGLVDLQDDAAIAAAERAAMAQNADTQSDASTSACTSSDDEPAAQSCADGNSQDPSTCSAPESKANVQHDSAEDGSAECDRSVPCRQPATPATVAIRRQGQPAGCVSCAAIQML